jgi:hypothetical protein
MRSSLVAAVVAPVEAEAIRERSERIMSQSFTRMAELSASEAGA